MSKKSVIVLNLGGSLIIPDKVDVSYLKRFRDVIKKNSRKHKFIIVCGGGNIARKYISALKEMGMSEILQSHAGIHTTRMNARFMSYFFNQNPKSGIPEKLKDIEKYLRKQDVVFCGALEYKPRQTSDSTTAEVARHFKSPFITLTNVPGLFDKNPKEFKSAKLIPQISWRHFHETASKIKYQPGQNFVLDQSAARIIMEARIPTYIMKEPKQLDNFLNKKRYIGTEING
ncbi:UMP kinase [Candidatus Pacearchaeota archaeon]|nr:UMP kinase [Candidatus Pacearchaeota archaeon]